jgi:hypothetical protein
MNTTKLDPAKLIWKSKPLSEEEIMDIAETTYSGSFEVESGYEYEIRLARAIEQRHGIK